MSADNHAHYTRIGFTLVIGVLAILGTVLYIGGVGNGANERYIETYYDYSVSGLTIGSSVSLRGVKIGEVRDIGFTSAVYETDDKADMQRIRIVMVIDPKMLGSEQFSSDELERYFRAYVEAGLRATVVSSGITGLSKIELAIPENPHPVAKLAWIPKYPLVPPQPSLLDNFSSSVTRAMNRFNKTDFGAVWTNVQEMTASASSIAHHVNELMVRERASIESSLQNFDALTSDLRELAAELKRNPSLLLRPRDAEPLPETMQ